MRSSHTVFRLQREDWLMSRLRHRKVSLDCSFSTKYDLIVLGIRLIIVSNASTARFSPILVVFEYTVALHIPQT